MGKTESPYDRRIRELEEEAERIRKNMNSLMKSVKREAESSRASFSTEPRIASTVGRASSVAPVAAETPEAPGTSSAHPGAAFADAAPAASSPAPAKPELPPYGSMRNRTTPGGPAARPQLSTYLASGSFGKGGPASRENRIQRNKAIFMAIVAVLALFILISQLL